MNGWSFDYRDPDDLAAAARYRAARAGDDPLAPARGCLFGLALCAPFWLALAAIVKAIRR